MNRGPRVTPFRVGGPIRDPADFAGREEVLQQIAHAMLNLQNVSLHGERRTGKTSVLLYLAHPASDTRLPETHIPVYFSFQDLAEASIVEVWQALADAVAAQIEQRHPDRQADSQRFLATTAEFLASSKAPALFGTGFGRALAQLEESGFKIHLLFDEFDQTARNPNLGDPFYDALRSLPIRAENISYVIASRTGLAALQPVYSKVSSPFFNIFTTIVLAPFREDEVHRLIFDYFARAGLDLSLAERLCAESAFLYDVTGYHPFFLQTLCYHLCAGLDKPEWPRGKAQHEALGAFRTDAEPHFDLYYWEFSSKEERELMGKLAIGQSVDWDALGSVARSLEDRCLIVPSDAGWQLFSSVFARWVEERHLASWYRDAQAAEGAGRRQEAIRLYVKILSADQTYRDVTQRLDRLGIPVNEICLPLLERYLVERELGQGGGGHIYLARDEVLGRYVALKHRKVLTPDDQRQAEILLQEARTVAQLRHPNVAVVHATESYPESGDYCVVMEYADGGTLADLLEAEGHLSLKRALDIGIEICTALQHVHRQELVHGDIKPSNILFFHADDHVDTKIADFGLSRSVLVGDQQSEDQRGAFSGTLEYAAPELLKGEAVDKRVDLYSLGAVLYHMLVGEPPFPFSGDLAAVIAGHLHGELTPPQESRPAVFDELNRLVLKALAKSLPARFQDAEAMLATLWEARELCTQYHEQAEKLYSQAIRLEKGKKWPGAVQSFERAHNLNPELKDVEQRLQNARLQLELESTWREMERLLAQDAWADALEQLGRIAKLAPEYCAKEVAEKTAHARLQLDLVSQYGDARAAEGAGRRREAIRLYVGIVQKDDSYRDATQRLARLRTEEDLEKLWTKSEKLVQNEKWEEAIETYQQMLDKDPGHAGAGLKLAYAQRKLELARLYAQALSEAGRRKWETATETLRDIITLEPGYRDAAVLLADVSRRQRLRELRQNATRAMEDHRWSNAAAALEELCRLESADVEAQKQLERVWVWQQFDDLYRQGKAECDAQRWDEAIAKLEGALKVADAAALDLHNYLDIRPLIDQARTNEQLDALHKEATRHEDAGDLNALIQVLDRMLKLDPGNQKALQWKDLALQRMRLRNLYSQASSRMEQRDWAGAKRLLDEIASVDAQFKNVQAMRAQITIGRGVSLMRPWGFALFIVLGVGLLLSFVPTLVTAVQKRLDFGSLVVTPEFVGTVISVFALIASVVGLMIPTERLYGLLERDKRLRAYVVLAVVLVMAGLLVLLMIAFVPGEPEPVLNPDELCNGSFEDRYNCWEKGGNLKQTIECEAGQCFVVLGNPSYKCESGVPVGEAWLRQSFQVPETVSPTLSLRYRVFSHDLDSYDSFQVSIDGEPVFRDGNTEWNVASCDGEVWDSGERSWELDLSPYIGKRIELSLRNVNGEHEWYNTWTYVDDVEVH